MKNGLPARRVELKDHAPSQSTAAEESGAVQIPVLVSNQISIGRATIYSSSETVQGTLIAVRVYLEDDPVAAHCAGCRSAVEVAAIVPNHTSNGVSSIGEPGKGIEHGFGPSAILVGRKPEYCALVGRAAEKGRAVDFAIRAESWTPKRIAPVWLSGKAVKDSQMVVRVQLENHSTAESLASNNVPSAPVRGVTVEIACTVSNQATVWVGAICSTALEGVEDGVVAVRIDLKYNSAAA